MESGGGCPGEVPQKPGWIDSKNGEKHKVAMTDEQWAEYQRQGLHLRPEQRTEKQLAEQRPKKELTEQTLSDNEQLTQIVTLLSTIKNILVFFLIVFIVGFVLSLFIGIGHSAH
jgi:hypothetical protein